MDTFEIPTAALTLILVIFISFSGFFSAAETALTGANKLRLKNLAKGGNTRARKALQLLNHFDDALSTILIGNNVVNIATASLAAAVSTAAFGPSGLALATVVTTIIILIFGEILPKSAASDAPEYYSMKTAGLLRILVVLFTPLNFLFRQLKQLAARLLGKKNSRKPATEDELLLMVDEVESGGGINKQDSLLIKSAIEFSDIRVREIMTPRVDMVAMDISEGTPEALKLFRSHGFSRLPVFKDDYGEIIGVLHAKDFFAAYLQNPQFDLKKVIKKAALVHQSTKISRVLKTLQEAKVEMAMVMDSYGTVRGLVTTEDIVEELVGEIWDEHDKAVSSFRRLGKNRVLVSCSSNSQNANLFDLFKVLDLDIDDYGLENNSISGWVVDTLETIPKKGDSFDCKNLHVTVTRANEHRVQEIIVEVRPEKKNSDEKA
ncbi:HlyC/CorC family transporter [Acidaminococcus timonensis]|jgi:putative hemolysin|uniref:HlyC/CorC family transporter n=1 Tax=Acidaminococcus timonensis TaxID=1871002 RepID=UPI003A5C10F5